MSNKKRVFDCTGNEELSKYLYSRSGKRPDMFDLRWEIIRRNQAFIDTYEEIDKDPKWADQPVVDGRFQYKTRRSFICNIWGLNRLENPSVAWGESYIIVADTKDKTKKSEYLVSPAMGYNNSILDSPVVTITGKKVSALEDDFPTQGFQSPDKEYLWFRVDPLAPKNLIKKEIHISVDKWRKDNGKTSTRKKIQERVKWLELVDKVEEKNKNPTPRTFTNLFGYGQKYRSKMSTYCKGKLLIKNPLSYPLRRIMSVEIEAYKAQINLINPHN